MLENALYYTYETKENTMPRTLKIAAVQMDATPAPVADRLARAADLVAEAASAGAQLIVLPEVFNTGYEYADSNYVLAETMDGVTVSWMKAQAAQHDIHLAGTLLLLDGSHVYNAMLLFAPDGRLWRYNKNYPWAWERAYFREGQGITVADTQLGKLGMMICWDYAHPDLWTQYAGKVDAMVISSCPPMSDRMNIVLPDGERYQMPTPLLYTGKDTPFGAELDEHIAWMGVPAVNTTGAGTFRTKMPLPKLSLFGLLALRPDLWKHTSQAEDAYLESGYYPQTKVVDANGAVKARVTETGDGFTMAEVALADTPPQPTAPQPDFKLTPLTYLLSDWITPSMTTPLYRMGLQRQSGAQMAPLDLSTKKWLVAVVGALFAGLWMGRRR
jgi:hypothetical protein